MNLNIFYNNYIGIKKNYLRKKKDKGIKSSIYIILTIWFYWKYVLSLYIKINIKKILRK